MSVTEFQRHQIFQWLEAQMGSEKAAIMMDLLPPVGWGDIATRADLDVLRAEIKAGNADLLLKLYFGIVASQATLVGLVLAAARFG
ncbi:MAG: hypothetical protein ABIP36_03305 [Acidimicrobiales bacterium]